MEKIEKLVEEIEKLTVIELADLVKAIEEKFGVSAAAAVVAAGAGAAAGAAAEEKTEFKVVLKEAGAIVDEEMRSAGLYEKIWQSFAIILPVKTVGVMGDKRTYDHVIVIRAVNSVDAMTADWVKLPYEILGKISSRIINEVKGANRVVYDISQKPPATIEWE